MIVAPDCAVELIYGCLVEGGARLLAYPLLELRIGRAFFGDERNDRIALQVEAVDDHLIEPVAYCGVSGREFAASIKGDLEPETWKVQNAEWSGDSGADEGNDG